MVAQTTSNIYANVSTHTVSEAGDGYEWPTYES